MTFTQVNHDLKWAYQSKNRMNYPILCADLGNTALKLAVFSREGEKLFYKRFSYDQIDLIPFLELRNKFNLPDGWPIHYISVNPDKARDFRAKVEDFQYSCAEVPKRSVAIDLSLYPIDQLGVDRLSLIEGLRVKYPNQNVICFSIGTAITTEVITAGGKYKGGYMLQALG